MQKEFDSFEHKYIYKLCYDEHLLVLDNSHTRLIFKWYSDREKYGMRCVLILARLIEERTDCDSRNVEALT